MGDSKKGKNHDWDERLDQGLGEEWINTEDIQKYSDIGEKGGQSRGEKNKDERDQNEEDNRGLPE